MVNTVRLACAAIPFNACGLTGIQALDFPSIAVKNPAGVLLTAVAMTASGRVVAVGEHGVVIYSDDCGANWRQAIVPVDVTLTCVAFATVKIGWAAGHFGVILNTQDGGETWVEQLNGIQANQLTLQAAQASTVAANPSPGAPIAELRAKHFVADGPDKPFLTMLIFSPRRLLVFGAYRLTMLSDDGGKTWQDWSLHVYDKYSHNIYGAATVGAVSYLVAEEGLMFASSDTGNSFLPLASPGGSTLFGILGARDGSLIVFGVAGFAARSADRGESWTTLTIATQQDLTSGRVLESGAIILVDESGLLFESTDNGKSLMVVEGIQPQPFFDVQQAENGALIVVGATGVTRITKSLLAS